MFFYFPLFLVDFVIGIAWVVMGCGGGDWTMLAGFVANWDGHRQRRERKREINKILFTKLQ